ncbi:hypothetical protein ACFL4W_04915 [Planctomycetota bacterium]
MVHKVEVPDKYTFGRTIPMTGVSSLERYVGAYEQAWWNCIEKYHKDINHVFKKSDAYGNGRLSAIEGWHDGFMAAEEHMQRLISTYGKKATDEHLRWLYDEGLK